MRQLLIIFAATTGFARPMAYVAAAGLGLFLAAGGAWLWADRHEVGLRNAVLAQQAVCDLDPANREERRELEARRAAHNTFLESSLTGVFVAGRRPAGK